MTLTWLTHSPHHIIFSYYLASSYAADLVHLQRILSLKAPFHPSRGMLHLRTNYNFRPGNPSIPIDPPYLSNFSCGLRKNLYFVFCLYQTIRQMIADNLYHITASSNVSWKFLGMLDYLKLDTYQTPLTLCLPFLYVIFKACSYS